MNILKIIAGTAATALIMIAAAGCHRNLDEPEPVNMNRRVLLFYECAFNDIGSYMRTNMEDPDKGLPAGYIPDKSGDVLLVYSRISKGRYDYTPVNSYLRRIYKTSKGKVVSDTLKVFDNETIATSPATLRNVLTLVKDEFPAKGYGMVFSSHGSGWLPAGYYSSPAKFEDEHKEKTDKQNQGVCPTAIPDMNRLPIPSDDIKDIDPYYGMTRSIGQDFIKNSYYGHEMSVSEFAEAIPYHLDYILFDMCFTGGVEVAYGLKDKADYLGLSPAEVLGDGMFDYTRLTSFLLKNAEPDLEGLFKDSFEMYDKCRYMEGMSEHEKELNRSATVNVIKTDGVENLAAVCKRLINDYSDAIANAPTYDIQGYFRSGRHYFYDLADIFKKCGASEDDLKDLDNAINNCVIYKNATEQFLGLFDIETYSGFSMYLPCAGTPILDSYYKKEAWNEAVSLVKED